MRSWRIPAKHAQFHAIGNLGIALDNHLITWLERAEGGSCGSCDGCVRAVLRQQFHPMAQGAAFVLTHDHGEQRPAVIAVNQCLARDDEHIREGERQLGVYRLAIGRKVV